MDTSKIKGYNEMTTEEKIAALETYEFKDLKPALDKASSEAAEWKRKYNALLTEEEQKKLAKDEEIQNMQAQLEELKKSESINKHRAQFIALGYPDDLAKSTATAMVDGDMDKVFEYQKQHQESLRDKLEAELLKNTTRPPAGNVPSEISKEQFEKMSYKERTELFNKDKELYKKLSGG